MSQQANAMTRGKTLAWLTEDATDDDLAEAFAFGVYCSGAMRAGATVAQCRGAFGKLAVEDRARWLQRGRDTITYALGYVP